VRAEDLKALLPDLEAFQARFGRYFCRTEGRQWARRYLAGLLMPIGRKNVENLAERVGAPPRKLQEFLSDSPWDDGGCITELQAFVAEHIGEAGGVLVVDDTGFAKKGTRSAGVGRQYSGTLGRTDNCQIGVFLGYASSQGHTLIDRRLYMTEAWFTDPTRRHPRAAVPEDLEFRTKHELALEMLDTVDAAGHVAYRWVTGDAAYGDAHDVRQAVADRGKWYCFEVSSSAQVWKTDPGWVIGAPTSRGGRPPSRPRPTPTSPESSSVAQLAAALPATKWIRHRVTEGAKGPREYEFARVRVIEKRHRGVGPAGWMMARRPVGATCAEAKYYLSNAPAATSLEEMAWVGCLRWTIEENFELAKGELGLDHYEVTKHRGWYHHVTLVLLALGFLTSVQCSWEKKTPPRERPGDPATPGGGASPTGVDTRARHCVVPGSEAPQARRAAEPPPSVAA
jgi:SRSO17 transposase